jgi:hypothetical protein
MNETENDERLAVFYDEICELREFRATCPITSELSAVSERYETKERVGRGGMKEVVRAIDRMTGREVALATVISDDPDHVESFLQEARVLAALEHPNIVPIYDVGLADSAYFTMQLLSGSTLGTILQRLKSGDADCTSRYSLRRRLDMVERVCEAIVYAHSQRVAHLDLKPDNIQVGQYGEILLVDWGGARRLDDPLEFPESHTAAPGSQFGFDRQIGTPGYMAPEQIDVRNGICDERTDVFALGAILYAVLTLEVPFTGNTTDEVFALTKTGTVQQPSQRCPDLDVPPGLEAICLKAMQPDPEARYQSVEAMYNDLLKYKGGFAPSAEEASFRKQIALLIRRNKKPCMMLLAATVLVILGVWWSVNQIRVREAETRDALALAESARADAEDALHLFRTEQAEKIAIGEMAAGYVSLAAKRASKSQSISETRRHAELAVVGDPDNPMARQKAGIYAFIDQDFAAALRHLALAGDKAYVRELAKLSRVAANRTSASSRLNGEELGNFLIALISDKKPFLATSMLVANVEAGSDLNQHLRAVELVLAYGNPKQTEWHLKAKVSSDGRSFDSLDLAGHRKLRSLRALTALSIDSLDLSRSGIGSLLELQNCRIRRLLIHNTTISDVQPLLSIPELSEIVIHPSQFTPPDLHRLKGRFKVTRPSQAKGALQSHYRFGSRQFSVQPLNLAPHPADNAAFVDGHRIGGQIQLLCDFRSRQAV